MTGLPPAKRVKIGIIVDTLGRYNSAAMRFAILKLNTLQTFVDFEVVYNLPDSGDFVKKMQSGGRLSRAEIKTMSLEFEDKIDSMISIDPPAVPPYSSCDRYLALCNVDIDDNFYMIRPGRKLRILAIGGWSRQFSPPSLLEFIIFNCVKQAVREAFTSPDSHRPSRGCLFDFNEELENTRNGALVGHLCGNCQTILAGDGDERWKEIHQLIGGKWLGNPTDPFSAYSELRRLGFRAFQASGVEDTRLQKIFDSISGKVADEIVKYAILAAVLYLALRLGLNDLVNTF